MEELTTWCGGDLYYSTKDQNGKWKMAKHMGETVNSDKLDYCPFVDVGRNNLYFTSERVADRTDGRVSLVELKAYANNIQNGMGDIYRINIEASGIE